MFAFDQGPSRRDAMIGSGTFGLTTALGTSGEAAAEASPRAAKPAKPPPNRSVSPVDRAFIRIDEGLVHYRYMDQRGARPELPIVLCHASPGSSERYTEIIPGLATNRLVIAPDMLGNGDSPPPAFRETEINYYVDATLRVMDALKVDRFDFYGAHTGAQIGCEMAVRHPDRIRRLALDGVPLFTPEFKQDALARYAPEVKPDAWGGHLAWAWHRAIEGSMYWPHYMHDEAHRLPSSDPTPEQIHNGMMNTLKVLSTYHIAYHAAFRQDVHALLPQITHPTLVMSIKRDPLHVYLDEAASVIRNAQKIMIETDAGNGGKLAALQQFFQI